jgi:quercetin dioxygenase-like cupin family protein
MPVLEHAVAQTIPQILPFIHAAGEGHTVSLWGATVTCKVASADTQGAWTLLEYVAPPHFRGPQLHYHRWSSEAFYILEGSLTFQLGARSVEARPGALVFVPPGAVHTFGNDADVPTRFLVFMAPGGFERYFDELKTLVEAEPSWPPADPGKLQALLARYDIHAPEAL